MKIKKRHAVIVTLFIFVGFAPVTNAQEGPSAEAQKITEAMWTEVKPTLEILQVQNVDSLKEKYIASAKTMMKRIDALPQDKKEALGKAAKPLTALNELKINKELKGSQKIFPPSIGNYVQAVTLAKLTPEQVSAIQKFLTGTWTRDWAAAKEVSKWQIAADGNVVSHETRRGKTEEPKNLVISFDKEHRMSVKTGTSTQTHVFLMHGNNFYTSSNTLYDVHKIADKNKFTIQSNREFIIYDNGTCTVISEAGVATSAQAAYETLDGKEVFKYTYQYPGEVDHMDKPRIHEEMLYVLGDYLAHSALVESGTWKK